MHDKREETPSRYTGPDNDPVLFDVNEPRANQDIFLARFDQSYPSRVCEYITGLTIENPDVAERISVDRNIIRGKYGLLSEDVILSNPRWYGNFLLELAQEQGVDIQTRLNCGNFFDAYPEAAAVYLGDGRIGTNIDKTTTSSYIESLCILEHELIHAMQYDGMPVEAGEYEAYVGMGRMHWAIDWPYDIGYRVRLFKSIIWSAAITYSEISKIVGKQINPVWGNAKYFITNIDRIDLENLSRDDKSIFEYLQRLETDYGSPWD